MSDVPCTPVSEHTPTPWALKPHEHDDWGWIRDADGNLACIARGRDDKDFDQHRRDRTDPYAANAAFIVEAVNSHDKLRADIATARKALEEAEKVWSCVLAGRHGGSPAEQREPILNAIRSALTKIAH